MGYVPTHSFRDNESQPLQELVVVKRIIATNRKHAIFVHLWKFIHQIWWDVIELKQIRMNRHNQRNSSLCKITSQWGHNILFNTLDEKFYQRQIIRISFTPIIFSSRFFDHYWGKTCDIWFCCTAFELLCWIAAENSKKFQLFSRKNQPMINSCGHNRYFGLSHSHREPSMSNLH